MRAIESVIHQTYNNIEIIVVDDNGIGSHQNETLQIVSKYDNIKLLTYAENKGGCYARNFGAQHATGDLLMFLDDDDYYLPNKVERHIQPFMQNKNLDMVLCSVKIVDEQGVNIDNNLKYPRGTNFVDFVLGGHVYLLMFVVKLNVFKSLGGLDDIPRFQDTFFMYKFFTYGGRLKILDEELLVVVEHNNPRVSTKNFERESKAYNILHKYQNQHSYLFSKKDFKNVVRKQYYELASIRPNCSIYERVKGIYYLVKSRKVFNHYKLLFRLILSDTYYKRMKLLFIK